MKKMINPITIVVIAALIRLLPHIPNLTPIGAMGLFGGAYLNKRTALLLPVAALLISDFFIGFYNIWMMLFVYSSFVLIGLIGILLRKRITPINVITASLLSSVIFYLITNFGVWLTGTLYPKNWSGLIDCYVLALPFFKNTLIGDLLYNGLFFFGYEAALKIKFKNIISHAESPV